MNADGTASFGSAIEMNGSHLQLKGFKTRLEFTDGIGDDGRGNVLVGDTSIGSQLTDEANSGYNVAVGTYALDGNTTSSNNTGLGYGSLSASTTSNYNSAVGSHCLQDNTTGSNNTAVGY